MSEQASEDLERADAKLMSREFLDAIEYAWEQGWGDGFPVIPPVQELVEEFLDYARLDPGDVIGEYKVRNAQITAQQVAINAVMAGCKPEYMPVVMAAIEAVTDADFHLNHIASTSSPWPTFIVNGPLTGELGLNHDYYVLGPFTRANSTIGRAISLTLANSMAARVGGVQQGTLGNPSRAGGLVLAEDEDAGWEPLSMLLDVPKGKNVVTAVGTMGFPQQIIRPVVGSAEALASVISTYIGEGAFTRGTYVVLLSPTFQRYFKEAGWSKQDLRRYLCDNTKTSVAQLKRKGRYANPQGQALRGLVPIEEGDEDRMVYLAGEDNFDGRYYENAKAPKTDFLIANAGGEAGLFAAIFRPFSLENNVVVKEIKG